MTVQDHLTEALYLAEREQSESAVGRHITSALMTMGDRGQSLILKTKERAREDKRKGAVSSAPTPAGEVKQARRLQNFVHPDSMGKKQAPPADQPPLQERITVKVARMAEPESQLSQLKNAQPVEVPDNLEAFKVIEMTSNIGSIGRPTTALNWFGEAQIKEFLTKNGIEFNPDGTGREIAASLIAHFKAAE